MEEREGRSTIENAGRKVDREEGELSARSPVHSDASFSLTRIGCWDSLSCFPAIRFANGRDCEDCDRTLETKQERERTSAREREEWGEPQGEGRKRVGSVALSSEVNTAYHQIPKQRTKPRQGRMTWDWAERKLIGDLESSMTTCPSSQLTPFKGELSCSP